jgi:hypothetical protein
VVGRFIQADSIIPSLAPKGVTSRGNPLAWDRYVYTNNKPVKYTDPSGHKACGDDDDCQKLPTPQPKDDIQTAISYLQHFEYEKSLYERLTSKYQVTIDFTDDGKGHLNYYDNDKDKIFESVTILVRPGSPTSIAGTIAHEAFHDWFPGGTVNEEYLAFATGDIVRNDTIQAGYGTASGLLSH